MTVETFSELSTEIAAWLDRDDLTDRIPTFIRMVEARLNRLLDDPNMEVAATVAASGPITTLPSDFGSLVSISTSNADRLQLMGPVEFAGLDRTLSGSPRYYTITGTGVSFAPDNSSAIISIVYRRNIPALTAANPTNWLLTRAPDVYLYGALMQAEGFETDDSRVSGWKAFYDEAVDELRADGAMRKWGAGPLSPRIRRT